MWCFYERFFRKKHCCKIYFGQNWHVKLHLSSIFAQEMKELRMGANLHHLNYEKQQLYLMRLCLRNNFHKRAFWVRKMPKMFHWEILLFCWQAKISRPAQVRFLVVRRTLNLWDQNSATCSPKKSENYSSKANINHRILVETTIEQTKCALF